MLDFNTYLTRHGEPGVQTIIELIEQREGITSKVDAPVPLEERWNAIMLSSPMAA